jgi:hypothetical protein
MKKKNLKGLHLNKKEISNLTKVSANGGATVGCTDGCSPVQTLWNCTRGNCTNDCTDGATYICSMICPSGELLCEAPE